MTTAKVCVACEACDPRFRHRHLTEVTWSTEAGMHRLELPHRDGITIGYWIRRSPIPFTPRWEWVVTNMPVTVVTGMSSGYTRYRWQAQLAVVRALLFWKRLGYVTTVDTGESRNR